MCRPDGVDYADVRRAKALYMITYPNGKVHVGMDMTGSLTYFGSPSGEYVAKDFTPEQQRRMSRVPWNFGGGPMIIRLHSRFHHDGRHRQSARRHAVRGRLEVLV